MPTLVLTPAVPVSLTLGNTLNVTSIAVTAADGLIPPVTISRTINHNNLAGDFTSDGASNFAGLSVSNIGAISATNGVQPVGVYAFAANQGTQAANGTGAGPDAAGFYGTGYITNGGNGTGIGGFFIAQRTASAGAGILTAAEVTVNNLLNAASYSATSVTDTCLWVNNASTNQAGSGILIGPANTTNKFDVGIGFMGGASGAVTNASIRDDGNAVSSYVINGSHTYGIDAKAGTFSVGAIRLPNNVSVVARNAAGSADVTMFYLDVSNALQFGPPLKIAGSSSLTFGDATDINFGTTTGTKFGTSATHKIGFYNTTPIVQPATTGTATGFVAGGGTTVTDSSTFTGAVGSTAYRISDIVKALKNLGLMAS